MALECIDLWARTDPQVGERLLIGLPSALESVHGATFVINPPQRQREPVLAPDSDWEVAANISFNAYSAVVQEPSRQ